MLVELEDFREGQSGRQTVLDEIDALQASIREVLNSVRDLLRDLRGESRLVSEAFTEVVGALLSKFERQTGIEVRLTIGAEWPAQLKAHAAVNLFRIIGEALTNVRRHSGARQVAVAMQSLGTSELSISVTDDGAGFGPVGVDEPGLGIVGMRERALLLGARLQIGRRDETGTTVSVVVPRGAITDRCEVDYPGAAQSVAPPYSSSKLAPAP
jgi:two-component system sensor histidine kinase UhpB